MTDHIALTLESLPAGRWRMERSGILFQRSLYGDQGHIGAVERAMADRLGAIWRDAIGFRGIEIQRRNFGRQRLPRRNALSGMSQVRASARRVNERDDL